MLEFYALRWKCIARPSANLLIITNTFWVYFAGVAMFLLGCGSVWLVLWDNFFNSPVGMRLVSGLFSVAMVGGGLGLVFSNVRYVFDRSDMVLVCGTFWRQRTLSLAEIVGVQVIKAGPFPQIEGVDPNRAGEYWTYTVVLVLKGGHTLPLKMPALATEDKSESNALAVTIAEFFGLAPPLVVSAPRQ